MTTYDADALFHGLLATLTLGFFGFVIAARVFQSVRATLVLSLVGAAAAFALAAIAPSSSIGRNQGLSAPLLAMGGILVAVGWYASRRIRRAQAPAEETWARERARLSPLQIALPITGWRGPGTCWHCGEGVAAPREIQLDHSVIAGTASVSESVSFAIPLCPHHPADVNERARQLEPLAVLAGVLAFAAGLFGALSLRVPEWLRPPLALSPFAIGIATGVLLGRWFRKMQTFRLDRVDPLTGVVVVRLNDPTRAQQARCESEQLWKAPG